MIPKTIHYCWFGGNKKSPLIEKCIRSWKAICPEYEIIEWNENNFDINICSYVKEAYENKKWAYVSDYARFYILNKFGGIYLDTDVELLKPIDDLISKGAFAGFSSNSIVATGLILACEQGNWFCKEVLASYDNQHFIDDDPSKILAIGRRVTALLVEHGLKLDGTQQVIDGMTIYPKSYFNPTDGDVRAKVDERAYSIHHYAATWFPKGKRITNTIRRFIGTKNMEKYYKLKSRLTGK
ncbi:MAG: glycosyltransferase family 32 protein [Eubacterium sp.]